MDKSGKLKDTGSLTFGSAAAASAASTAPIGVYFGAETDGITLNEGGAHNVTIHKGDALSLTGTAAPTGKCIINPQVDGSIGRLIIAEGGSLTVAQGFTVIGEISTSAVGHHIQYDVMGDGSVVFTVEPDTE
jgi:hypothetical protein